MIDFIATFIVLFILSVSYCYFDFKKFHKSGKLNTSLTEKIIALPSFLVIYPLMVVLSFLIKIKRQGKF